MTSPVWSLAVPKSSVDADGAARTRIEVTDEQGVTYSVEVEVDGRVVRVLVSSPPGSVPLQIVEAWSTG